MAEESPHIFLGHPAYLHDHAPRRHMLSRHVCWHATVSEIRSRQVLKIIYKRLTVCINSTQLIILIICISSLLLAITEIILFAIHNLRPIAYLIFQCVKTASWFIVLIIAIVVTADQQRIGGGGGERYSPGLLVLLDGLLEAVVLVYVKRTDRSSYLTPQIEARIMRGGPSKVSAGAYS